VTPNSSRFPAEGTFTTASVSSNGMNDMTFLLDRNKNYESRIHRKATEILADLLLVL